MYANIPCNVIIQMINVIVFHVKPKFTETVMPMPTTILLFIKNHSHTHPRE